MNLCLKKNHSKVKILHSQEIGLQKIKNISNKKYLSLNVSF